MADSPSADRVVNQIAVSTDQMGNRPGNRPLPVPLTSFVGREREVAAVSSLLEEATVRLVTLVGPGGVGKTRLALQVATKVERHFVDGVVFIPLAEVRDPAFLLPTIAHHLGARDVSDQPLLERIADTLTGRHLLILDNFEHLLDAACFAADLLAATHHLTLLVTSRAALRISGEQEFAIPPLDAEEATRLFADRARAVRRTFSVTADNERAIAELCSQFDRLPLAVELAAARSKVLSPEAMLARLEHRLPFLVAGPTDVPQRLQTMYGAISWSYDLLTPEERGLFRHAAVFVGGFSLEAAEEVCRPDGTSAPDLLTEIASLVDKSLLVATEQAGNPRFSMLETIREFALEQLDAHGETAEFGARHAAYVRSFAERARPELYGANQLTWFDLVQQEQANIRAALTWSEARQDADTYIAIAAALWPFWFTRGHLGEGRDHLERALALPHTPGSNDWVETIHGLGSLAHQLGDYQRTFAAGEELSATSEAVGNAWGVARGQYLMSRAVGALGDPERAATLAEKAVRGFRDLDDDLWLAYALHRLGVELAAVGDFDGALTHYREAAVLWHRVGNTAGAAMTADALADAARQVGDDEFAARSAHESLALYAELGDPVGIVESLLTVAALVAPKAPAEEVVRVLGAADKAREALGLALYAHPLATVERVVPMLRSRLGERGFAVAWSAGQQQPLDVVITEALALVSTTEQTTPTSDLVRADGGRALSSREQEVLALLVSGSSDREIADALFISHRTAQGHVARILDKLNVPNRAAAAAVAYRDGLLEDEVAPPS